VPPGLLESTPVTFFGTEVWNGYANQPAADIIQVPQAQQTFGVYGSGIVAIIDTGVDPHPALQNVLVPGYDFTRNQSSSTSETADLDRYQSTAAVVDGDPTPLNNSIIAVLDPSAAALIAGPDYAAFGHGTMVAGIVHLVAPDAFIMPLKTFEANGQGYLSDILRAIYWAAGSGARVLNMSFSTPSYSREFETALDYAANQNLISVAAAGNNGNQAVVYPAGFRKDVMGVASTNMMDERSSFSNYGPQDVWVAAPGEGIISTYPFNTYAAGWGTSFSAPFVSGTAALLLDMRPGTNESSASEAIANAKRIKPDLGNGRLDVYQALSAVESKK
jgi:thermitase